MWIQIRFAWRGGLTVYPHIAQHAFHLHIFTFTMFPYTSSWRHYVLIPQLIQTLCLIRPMSIFNSHFKADGNTHWCAYSSAEFSFMWICNANKMNGNLAIVSQRKGAANSPTVTSLNQLTNQHNSTSRQMSSSVETPVLWIKYTSGVHLLQK